MMLQTRLSAIWKMVMKPEIFFDQLCVIFLLSSMPASVWRSAES
jgi:hypothetical protein